MLTITRHQYITITFDATDEYRQEITSNDISFDILLFTAIFCSEFSELKLTNLIYFIPGTPGAPGPEGPRGESGAPGFGLPGERGEDGIPG